MNYNLSKYNKHNIHKHTHTHRHTQTNTPPHSTCKSANNRAVKTVAY